MTEATWGQIPRKSVYDPKYPVVKQFPTMGEILGNMSLGDYTRVGTFGATGYLFGYAIAHRPYTLRGPTAAYSAVTFAVGGLFASYLASRQRLVGDAPNKAEWEAMMRAKQEG
uniref:NADH-ubiquinone oxidoreductase 21kDa subunit N-terminal domain-containing protein n=1 Tax=Phaeomonas parva TaxID=124430 RepID=A0A6U4KJK6_9STRA|mmetsp:Transcript_45039/g.141071  ORF Transcript_45039/g.141071 Transcript_45039/m.141071 type:complete len:113 (+) Transcript_45039:124-462(+)|eukprot:CAMPEP_0118853024 /NCGR_PEP_ID=MMETSP1163-20130328/1771_1 /TAXON_ID=124430 /ORGANISM="Phaeomonas parva, Strain CCMP2877" /LENGTH=112 /DNA_ID=CAMNT_0006785505 /DNA_START=110 /DNA_END=448 /DNA_ORIENTATION=+